VKLIISFIFISFFHTCWANARVALVFSGGGARGLAHIGVIKVLEENKIPIDFIVGNSMGSIIGGLYAAGYSAQQLEDEVRMIPWTQVFTDQSLRRNVSLRQKFLQDRVALSFPVRNGKVSLPTGLVKGNTLKKHLRRLCWPIRNIKNFNDLEIPFMAISTDILSGRAVQLTSGELAEAMQASMSLPSVFQPQKVDGKLLMDGMMIRNLPVQDAKETGADVLIAVDVGTKLYKETELNSMVDIIDQSISFMNVQTSAYQESLADVLIRPRVKDYTTGQFSDFDSLIKLGETAAREKLPQIKQILASKGINGSKSINRVDAEEWSKPIRIEQITIEGLDKDLTRYIEKEFGNQYPLTMTQDEIEEIVDRVYGTDVFDWVTYEVHGHHLVLKLSPKETRDLNIGLNYNSDERLSMLINTRLRLVGLKTLKSELDIKLGQWNEFESHNIFILNKKITKHTSLHNLIRIREFDISHADNLAPVDFHEYMGEFSLQTSANNNRRWLFGIRGRQIHLKDGFPHLNLQSQEDLWQLFAGFHYDSLDVSTFPTEGTLLYLDYEYAHEDMNDISDFSRQSFKFARYNKLNTSSSIFGVYKESRAEGPVVSLHAKTYLGGQSKFLWDHTSFLGYKRLSSSGNYSQSLLLGYQNEIAPDFYIRALINAGLATDNKSDLYEYSKMKQAAGVELGYKARYGSAKIGVYHNREGTYSLYFDLGHRF
tara:strand:- start:1149 stop:3284 length:2136 start_codon:yes stop_codon:yes gene_type:complete